jgi:hypothetical protein
MSKAVKLSLLCAVLFSSVLSAQEQRWFEVEMLIFRQSPPASLLEQFGETVTPIKPGRAYDLITPRYQPDLTNLLAELPLCSSSTTLQYDYQFTVAIPRQLCIFEPQPHSWQHSTLFQQRNVIAHIPYPAELPTVISADGKHQNRPYLAESQALQLTDIANKIRRQSGNQLLLHTSWRQAPVTERRAIASRWFGGRNFSEQFDYWGQPKTVSLVNDPIFLPTNAPVANRSLAAKTSTQAHEIMHNIEQLLQQLKANNQLPDSTDSPLVSVSNGDPLALRNLPDQVWQLDGLFKLHLDHYLFVNTEFNLRLPANNELQTIYVRQSRRVISGEIHYLDHPHLGIVLQIRRYDPDFQQE